MTAAADELRFFVDESALGVGKALSIARRDVIHPGHPLIPTVKVGALDTEWIPEVAQRGLIVLARDRHIRTKPAELVLLRGYGLRVFWLAGKRDLSSWDYLVSFVQRWEDIERAIADHGAGPWFIAINDRTLIRLAVQPTPPL